MVITSKLLRKGLSALLSVSFGYFMGYINVENPDSNCEIRLRADFLLPKGEVLEKKLNDGRRFFYSREDYLRDVKSDASSYYYRGVESVETFQKYSSLVDVVVKDGNSMDKLDNILDFVFVNMEYKKDGTIPYRLEDDSEYVKTALQSLVEGSGDCDDFANTVYSISKVAGIDEVYIALTKNVVPGGPGHALIAFEVNHDFIENLESFDNCSLDGSAPDFKRTIVYAKGYYKYFILFEAQSKSDNKNYVKDNQVISEIIDPVRGIRYFELSQDRIY